MIQRIFTAKGMRCELFALRAFCFTKKEQFYTRNMDRLQISECRNIDELYRHFSTKKNHSENQLRQYCHLINEMHVGSQGKYQLSQMLDFLHNLDVKTLSTYDFANFCGVLSVAMVHKINTLNPVKIEFLNRLTELLDDKETMDETHIKNLFKMIKFVQIVGGYKILPKLLEIVEKRCDTLKINERMQFINLMTERKFPVFVEKKALEEVLKSLGKNWESLEVKQKILFYKFLKKMNKGIYDISKYLQLAEKDIKLSLEDLEQKQIFTIINFTSVNNQFIFGVFLKIVQAIDEEGKIFLNVPTVLFMLTRISEVYPLSAVGKDKAQIFFKFVEENASRDHRWITLIENDFFNHHQLEKLESVFQQKKLFRNYNVYIWEMMSRGIYLQNYDSLIFSIGKPDKNALNNNFLLSSILLHHLCLRFPENQAMQKALDEYKEVIQNLGEDRDFTRLEIKSKKSYLQQFIHDFPDFYQNKIDSLLGEEKPVLDNKMLAFISGINDFENLVKFHEKNGLKMGYLIYLITRATEFPRQFKTNIGFLTKAYNMMGVNDRNYKNAVNFVCSEEIQSLISTQDLPDFFSLTCKLVDSFTENQIYLPELIKYFIFSPHRKIKAHSGYKDFLLAVQKKYPLYQNFSRMVVFVCRELRRNSLFTKEFVEEISKTFSNPEFNDYFQLFLENPEASVQKIQINELNLSMIMKFGKSEKDLKWIGQMKTEIISTINTCMNSVLLEEMVLNFDLPINEETTEILHCLISKVNFIIDRTKNQTYINIKISEIIHKIPRTGPFFDSFRKLLRSSIRYFSFNLHEISLETHASILELYVSYEIKCEDYLNRLSFLMERKLKDLTIRNLETGISLINLIYLMKPNSPVFNLSSLIKIMNINGFTGGRDGFFKIFKTLLCKNKKFNPQDLKQISKLMDNFIAQRVPVRQSEIAQLVEFFPQLEAKLSEMNGEKVQHNPEITQAAEIIANCCREKNIGVEIVEVEGLAKLIIEGSYLILLWDDYHSFQQLDNLKSFLKNVFPMEQEQYKRFYIFCVKNRFSKDLQLITSRIEPLKPIAQEICQKIQNHLGIHIFHKEQKIEDDNKAQKEE